MVFIAVAKPLGDSAKIMGLPESLDPNDFFLKYKRQYFEALKNSALDLTRYKIRLIYANTEKTELLQKLESVLKELSLLDKVKSDLYLNYDIKQSFGLKRYEINAYISLMDSLRKKEKKDGIAIRNYFKSTIFI
jgi:hypothetical protein